MAAPERKRTALITGAALVAAALVWLALDARPHGGRTARTASPVPAVTEARPSTTTAPARREPPRPQLSSTGPAPRASFLASAEDKWERLAVELDLSPDRAARGWEIIRFYRDAVYPQFAATAARHQGEAATGDPDLDRAREVAYLEELYSGPVVEAARTRALEELRRLLPVASLAVVRKVEPSLFPDEDIAALAGSRAAGAD